MKCKLLFLLLTLLCSGVSAKAQVRFTDDPNTAINMDIEAKSESAILNIQTFSRTSQIVPDAYVVITFMNDSVVKLLWSVQLVAGEGYLILGAPDWT